MASTRKKIDNHAQLPKISRCYSYCTGLMFHPWISLVQLWSCIWLGQLWSCATRLRFLIAPLHFYEVYSRYLQFRGWSEGFQLLRISLGWISAANCWSAYLLKQVEVVILNQSATRFLSWRILLILMQMLFLCFGSSPRDYSSLLESLLDCFSFSILLICQLLALFVFVSCLTSQVYWVLVSFYWAVFGDLLGGLDGVECLDLMCFLLPVIYSQKQSRLILRVGETSVTLSFFLQLPCLVLLSSAGLIDKTPRFFKFFLAINTNYRFFYSAPFREQFRCNSFSQISRKMPGFFQFSLWRVPTLLKVSFRRWNSSWSS